LRSTVKGSAEAMKVKRRCSATADQFSKHAAYAYKGNRIASSSAPKQFP
jgi:hypothetical protein